MMDDYYTSGFSEAARLTTRSAQGQVEFARTQELVRERIGPASRILDAGGGPGTHAAALAAAGHTVTLIDPVAVHVTAAAAHGTFTAAIGDARALAFADRTFDAVLLLGPLYHLRDPHERALALREAARVTRPGGWIFAAAIPRTAAFTVPLLRGTRHVPHLAVLTDGEPDPGLRFPAGHFHTAESLSAELGDAGLIEVEVVGLEGPAGIALEHLPPGDSAVHEAAMTLARTFASTPGVQELSNHLLASGRAPR